MSSRTRPLGLVVGVACLLGLLGPITSTAASTPDSPDTTPAGDTGTAPPEREWTILYYGMADNDLETALISDVIEMGRVNFGPDVAMYGLLDRSSWTFPDQPGQFGVVSDGDIPGLGDFTGTKAFVAVGGQLVSMADLGEVDMGHPDTLAWFVAEALRVAPAKHVALIMSDHGFGPLGIGPDYSTAVGEFTPEDEAAGVSDELTDLDGRELARALRRGLGGQRLDLLAFDACLMGNLETARFLTPVADYLVAAEDVIPGSGFDYTALSAVAENPQLSPVDLGRVLIDGYERYYTEVQPTDAITLALYDLAAIDRLERATESLSRALTDSGAGSAFGTAATASAAQITLDSSGADAFIDLGDLARRLAQPGTPDSVRIAADSVYAATGAAIVHQYRANGRSDATGISITNFPEGAVGAFAPLLAPYWNEWLLRYYGSVLPLPTRPDQVWTSTEAKVAATADGVVVAASLRPDVATSGGVVGATAMFGAPLGADEIEITVRYPAVLNSGEANRVAAAWGLASFALADGTTVVRPTVELEQNSELLIGRIGGVWVLPNGTSSQASVRFTVNPTTGTPGTPALYVQQASTGAWAEIPAEPGGRFFPDIQVLSGTGSEISITRGAGLAFDGLEVRPNRQTTGTVAAALGAIGSDGAITAVSGTIDL